jgi:hypothetical protein
MAGPLFRRGVLCFEGGIGGDVLRHVFGPDDFFRKQIKAERRKEERRTSQQAILLTEWVHWE